MIQELGLGPQGLRAPVSAFPECFQGHREKRCLLVEGFRHQQPGRWEWGEEEEATVTSKARRGCSGPLESLTPKYNGLFKQARAVCGGDQNRPSAHCVNCLSLNQIVEATGM